MKLIYLCSPFTHKNKLIELVRKEAVTKCAAHLTKKYGYALFLPITQSWEMTTYIPSLGGKFKQWKAIDLFMVGKKCDEIWVFTIPGWKESVGVQAEIKCALKHKKPLKYINPKTYKVGVKA